VSLGKQPTTEFYRTFLANEKLNFFKHHLVSSPYRHGCIGFLRFWERGYMPSLTSTRTKSALLCVKWHLKKKSTAPHHLPVGSWVSHEHEVLTYGDIRKSTKKLLIYAWLRKARSWRGVLVDKSYKPEALTSTLWRRLMVQLSSIGLLVTVYVPKKTENTWWNSTTVKSSNKPFENSFV